MTRETYEHWKQSISKPDFAMFEVLSGEGEGKLMKNIIA